MAAEVDLSEIDLEYKMKKPHKKLLMWAEKEISLKGCPRFLTPAGKCSAKSGVFL